MMLRCDRVADCEACLSVWTLIDMQRMLLEVCCQRSVKPKKQVDACFVRVPVAACGWPSPIKLLLPLCCRALPVKLDVQAG